eukprot:11219161-Lingulodinium_polyedra.AAC.1
MHERAARAAAPAGPYTGTSASCMSWSGSSSPSSSVLGCMSALTSARTREHAFVRTQANSARRPHFPPL